MPGILELIPVLGEVIDRVIPDPQAKMDLQIKLATLADQEAARDHEESMGQIEVNKVEAASPNLFVAGWRPFIGWVGGGALAYNVILAPVFHLGVADTSFLQTILLAVLGMGAMRSYDKAKGTSAPWPGSVTPVVQPAAPKKKILGIAWPF
jgi:hypothetical protein